MAFVQKQVDDFLGKGVTLPMNLVNGAWPLETGVTLIRESIKMILRWVYGTRFFLVEFGSKLEQLLEEPNDEVLRSIAYELIVDALSTWEKRVEVIEVAIERPDFHKLNLKLTYMIVASKKTDTFVFPFYSKITT